MVALNSQFVDHYSTAMHLFFQQNKNKTPGYRLKNYKDNSNSVTFKITPISCIMMTSLQDSNSIPSVQINMQFLGCSTDMLQQSSKMDSYTECI